jgi:mur ligase family, glutamate ligase domain
MEKILASVESFPGVEGRLEEFTINNKKVFVDFAHTPDGLEKTLSYLKGQKGN